MEPRRRNLGAYCGERIHVEPVTEAICDAGRAAGGEVRWQVHAGAARLLTIRIPARDGARRVYLSAGIHGDEPAGPMAVLQLLEARAWPNDCELWICPLLNPVGLERNTREDGAGVDLNRDYLARRTLSVRAHVEWLGAVPRFDCGLHLHEDWEATGFYLYELNPRDLPTRGEQVIRKVKEICPIDTAEMIDGRHARNGILRPNIDPSSREDWPEAFYMVKERTDLSYTLESPSDFPLPVRMTALVTAVNTLLREVEL